MQTIPANIYQRLKEFLLQGRTGQIALNVADGKIQTADVKEHIKAQAQ